MSSDDDLRGRLREHGLAAPPGKLNQSSRRILEDRLKSLEKSLRQHGSSHAPRQRKPTKAASSHKNSHRDNSTRLVSQYQAADAGRRNRRNSSSRSCSRSRSRSRGRKTRKSRSGSRDRNRRSDHKHATSSYRSRDHQTSVDQGFFSDEDNSERNPMQRQRRRSSSETAPSSHEVGRHMMQLWVMALIVLTAGLWFALLFLVPSAKLKCHDPKLIEMFRDHLTEHRGRYECGLELSAEMSLSKLLHEYFPRYEHCEGYLQNNIRHGDVLLLNNISSSVRNGNTARPSVYLKSNVASWPWECYTRFLNLQNLMIVVAAVVVIMLARAYVVYKRHRMNVAKANSAQLREEIFEYLRRERQDVPVLTIRESLMERSRFWSETSWKMAEEAVASSVRVHKSVQRIRGVDYDCWAIVMNNNGISALG